MYKENWEKVFLNNYGTPNIQLVEGEGVLVKDSDGNIYLDFLSGIAVNALGHSHPKIVEAVTKQISKLSHTSNFYSNEPAYELAEKLIEISGLDAKVFFCNSGTEANEAALKISRLTKRKQIISLKSSFHGRTIGSLSITGQVLKRTPFLPLLPNITFLDLNNLRQVKRKIGRKTAAFFVESIQGEGGVYEATDEYLNELRVVTKKRNTLLVLDEVQTGMGRTGQWFGFQQSGISPDIITLAKGLGGGLPMGAVLVSKEKADLLQPGQHGSTFGGNPVVASAALAVISTIENENLLENATEMGNLLINLLQTVNEIVEIRGRGLLIGFQLRNIKAKDLENECKNMGLLLNAVTENTIRLAPALIVNMEQVTRCVEIIVDAINSLEKAKI